MRPDLAYDEAGNLLIDVRGPRFGAAITATLLGTALILQGTVGVVLVAVQVTHFAVATVLGLEWSPWGNVFRFVKHRLQLGPPPETEAEAPPRFAQGCGLVFAGAGLVALLLGFELVGWLLVGVVLGLSALLALTGLCIGCELYLVGQRLRRSRSGGVV